MKAYWGSGSTAPPILFPRHQMEVSGQLHVPAALLPGKEPLVPSGWRVGEPQNRSGRGGEEKNSKPPPAIEP